ncbi:Methylthioribose-1-phosphate isomerase [Frankliniella fusca]|uniref:Methylthioribose-1-phosphate isomerase n=1 Tax=Frankliniella fusca TaxID=407009 RepID=A0AAE1GRP0_9NEOP|nr:Methylthioribose-1-phosphate isomerase [Frankliniella fusca]
MGLRGLNAATKVAHHAVDAAANVAGAAANTAAGVAAGAANAAAGVATGAANAAAAAALPVAGSVSLPAVSLAVGLGALNSVQGLAGNMVGLANPLAALSRNRRDVLAVSVDTDALTDAAAKLALVNAAIDSAAGTAAQDAVNGYIRKVVSVYTLSCLCGDGCGGGGGSSMVTVGRAQNPSVSCTAVPTRLTLDALLPPLVGLDFPLSNASNLADNAVVVSIECRCRAAAPAKPRRAPGRQHALLNRIQGP